MNSIMIFTAAGVIGLIIAVRVLIWYFDRTVCIACYDKVRVRKSKPAPGFRKEEYRLCEKCFDGYSTVL